MKKYILLTIMSLMFVFVLSTNVFAAPIRVVEISDIDYPYLGDKIDKEVKIKRGECTIKEVIWYKDDVKFLGDTFTEKGNYYCRVYFIPNEGYEVTSATQGASNAPFSVIGQDINGYFCELQYVVDFQKIEYPTYISFLEMNKPEINKLLDYSVVPEQPEFYKCTKIEWYSNNQLLHNRVKVQEGEYVCRVYMEFYNGFEINSKVVATLSGKKADKITRDHTGIYFEIVYNVSKKEANKEVLMMNFIVKEVPSYGRSVESVNILKTGRSNYYEVSDIVWYHDGYRMVDDYFYEGTYLCRIYINFINGGYPVNTTVAYIGDDSKSYGCKWMNNRCYIEKEFKIKEYTISTLKFNELNIPEYGSVQDTRIESLEPGIYSPSMVYWYNESGKYMSNMETFVEGKYTCKFAITLNVNCKVKEKLKAIINDSTANVYMENNKITIEKTYEIKKPTTKWNKASEWAIPELKNAIDYALIPNSINNQDFTRNITRAEFAAVTVRLYEALTLKSARIIEKNPFTDTKDSEVLKAYNLGITNGTSATTFEPNSLITRQEMATMMVRTLEKADVSTKVNLNNVKKFADHDKIEDWALNGVYFMSNIGIIKGKGNNVFDVLGSATREEALAISIRSVNYYK